MAICLLGFGSNLGDREEVLRAAIVEIDALPGVRVLRESKLIHTRPVGGPAGQPEFVNGAAVIETEMEPLELLLELQQIEAWHGRQRLERWGARTLDIDLLLVDERVIEMAALTVPHPRMSFRRFVLEPSAEIAGEMVHPTIGWTISRLLDHLNGTSDLVAIVAPTAKLRDELAEALVERFAARVVEPPTNARSELLWPTSLTTWVHLASDEAERDPTNKMGTDPKLTLLLDTHSSPAYSKIAAERGRGPTLQVDSQDRAATRADVFAAIGAVWPRLGPKGG